MKVAPRLYLAALPSLLGLVLVAALAYWGQYAHTVPEVFLVVAAIATVVTLVMSWANVRYVATRVERLSRRKARAEIDVIARRAGSTSDSTDADELDDIEGAFDNLSRTVKTVQDARELEARLYEQGTASYASLMAKVSTLAIQQLDEVRLPLHILLDNHFGELNENQEELLGAARVASECADLELVALKRIAELDLGIHTLRRDRVFPADLLYAVLPMIQSIAAQHHATLHADIPPLVPAILGDAAQLQEAMVVLFGEAVSRASDGDELQLALTGGNGAVQLSLMGARRRLETIRAVLAERVIQSSGGTYAFTDAGIVLTLFHDPLAGATTGFSK